MSSIKRRLEDIQDAILLGNADELAYMLQANGVSADMAWMLVDDFFQAYGNLWEALTNEVEDAEE